MAALLFRSLGYRLGLDRRGAVYGLTLFFSAMLAFSLASLFHVQNAYWAAMPIWVVAQTQRGMLVERAVYRVLGTLLGSAAGLAILQLVHDPYIALAALCLWIAVNAGMTHMLRRAGSYAALMSGITAAVVVFPSLQSSSTTLDLAFARIECTLIGVIVVTLVTGIFTPNSQRDAFYARVRALTVQVVQYVAQALQEISVPGLERRILDEISALEGEADLALAGTVGRRRRLLRANAFIAASLGLMAVTRGVVRRAGHNPQAVLPFSKALESLAERLRVPRTHRLVREDVRSVMAGAPPGSPRLAEALTQLVDAQGALCLEEPFAAQDAAARIPTLAARYELPLALQTAAVAGVATYVVALTSMAEGWQAGELVALSVCIFSMVLGSMPKPQAIAPFMFKGMTVGVIAAVLYRFTVAPHVATVAGLILSIMPFVFVGAFARASRKWGMAAIDANMCFMLAGQAVLPAVTDARVIIEGGLAVLLGGTLITWGFILLPRKSAPLAAHAAREVMRDLRRLAASAKDRRHENWQPRALRQTLRMMLHLGRANDLREHEAPAIFATLNLGNAIVDIDALSRSEGLDAATRSVLDRALLALAHFGQDPRGIAGRLDAMADEIGGDAAVILRDAALALPRIEPLIERAKGMK